MTVSHTLALVDMVEGGENAADYEQVAGNQIPHRVAALTPEGWRIMTPTKAKTMGYYAHRFDCCLF